MSKAWYILQTLTNNEGKVERTIKALLEKGELDPAIVCDVKIPLEEVVDIKDGKKKVRNEKILPGYIMVELDLPDFNWKATCSTLRRINGCSGFIGINPNERPRPISGGEAKSLLQKSGLIKGEKQVKIKQSYSVGDRVKITDGPFASFEGIIEEVNDEKDKLRVNVQIFGRSTPVEVSVLQVERLQ